ncbi:hypothetical protein RERY_21910 [Rhodococcus erythropolis]|nr:hypothetical protein RERY_21910 [Rhodococcus erythropolis]
MAFVVKSVSVSSGGFERKEYGADCSYHVTDAGVLRVVEGNESSVTYGVGQWHSVEDDGELPEIEGIVVS